MHNICHLIITLNDKTRFPLSLIWMENNIESIMHVYRFMHCFWIMLTRWGHFISKKYNYWNRFGIHLFTGLMIRNPLDRLFESVIKHTAVGVSKRIKYDRKTYTNLCMCRYANMEIVMMNKTYLEMWCGGVVTWCNSSLIHCCKLWSACMGTLKK